MKHRSDEELVRELASAESTASDKRRALAELIRRHERSLYVYLLRFTSNEAMAEDLFQEVFIKLMRSAWRFDPSRPLKPWLYTIAANLARDELRRKRWQVEVSLDAPRGEFDRSAADFMAGTVVAPDDEASSREEARILRESVAELAPPFRRVVELHFFRGMTCRETAAALGIPVGTVKSRLHTSLERLSTMLEDGPARRAAAG